jgi:hypothetical protein
MTAVDRSDPSQQDEPPRYGPGPVDADAARKAAFAAAFGEAWPEPSPEQRAAVERHILAAIRDLGGDVQLWSRVRRRIPRQLRQFDSLVLNSMYDEGKLWVMGVGGRWLVAVGGPAEELRVESDRRWGTCTTPRAI